MIMSASKAYLGTIRRLPDQIISYLYLLFGLKLQQ